MAGKRVLLAGAGDLCQRAARLLLAQGDEVWGLRRHPPPNDAGGIQWLSGDLTQKLDMLPTGITHIVYAPTPNASHDKLAAGAPSPETRTRPNEAAYRADQQGVEAWRGIRVLHWRDEDGRRQADSSLELAAGRAAHSARCQQIRKGTPVYDAKRGMDHPQALLASLLGTVDFVQIKQHCYQVQKDIIPTQIVPKGPDLSGWRSGYGREALGGRPFGDGTAPGPVCKAEEVPSGHGA